MCNECTLKILTTSMFLKQTILAAELWFLVQIQPLCWTMETGESEGGEGFRKQRVNVTKFSFSLLVFFFQNYI